MSNTLQRLLLFLVAIPTIFVLIVFLPQYHHAAISLMIILGSAGAAWELAGMLKAKDFPARRKMSAFVGGAIPLVFWISTWFHNISPRSGTIVLGIACLVIFLMSPFAFVRTEAIDRLLPEVLALFFIVLYPGLLAGYLVFIAAWFPFSTEAMMSFAFISLANDSLAWLFGVTLGRTRNLVAVSPNKSVAGFVGGLFGSVGFAFVSALLFPSSIPMNPPVILLLGFLTGVATIIGDLFESALKRSAGVKDSGSVIPGRGGFLDSMDSLLFAAPVFFAISSAFHLFS
jgi:phosphatidate cytidylyltransferase